MLKSAVAENFEIKATHLYVRFLPQDSVQVNHLLEDTAKVMFDYPLDYEVLRDGNFYHDPGIPKDRPTWLYTVVPINVNLPDIPYEIIEECFIPPDVENSTDLKSAALSSFYEQLEYEAFRITGNLCDGTNLKSLSIFGPRHRPAGRIQVYNTEVGWQGVRGVEVRVHNFMRIGRDYTDLYGNYQINKQFRTRVRYAVIFENARGFKIWGNRIFIAPARFGMGGQSNRGYSHDIGRGSEAWKWATVNNAICKYLDYCIELSIRKPPSDLRVWVRESNKHVSGAAPMLRRTFGLYGFNTNSQIFTFLLRWNVISFGVNYLAAWTEFAQPDIMLFVNYDDKDLVDTEAVYYVTFHELAHASHWAQAGNRYWVRFINAIITYGNPMADDRPYGDGTGQNAGYVGVGEMWGFYFGALLTYMEFSSTDRLRRNAGRLWFNPGFLQGVDSIPDITTSEIFGCLTPSTNTIAKLVEQLKTKTEYDERVDSTYNRFTDWP